MRSQYVLWSTSEIIQRRLRWDTKKAVQRGVDFAEMNRPFRDFGTQAIGGADDLAGPEATAGNQAATDLGPVVAPGVVVDLGSAPKFPPGNHCHVVG